MTFPVVFHPLGVPLHAHVLFEALAYTLGFQTFLLLRRRRPLPAVGTESQLWILVGCVFGAFAGSKVLAWAESWPDVWARRGDWQAWVGGKTIVGGLIGGWGGVEIAKALRGVRGRTGDAYVVPLCLAIAVGRVGCFLTGLADHTHGVATGLPWGVDFGDSVRRHPTQLYEIAWLSIILAAFAATGVGARRETDGRAFRWFLIGYLLFRFAVEFIKPTYRPYAGLSAIQVASLMTVGVAAWQLWTAARGTAACSPSA